MSNKAYGICMGASTISAVELVSNGHGPQVSRVLRRPHEGNPQVALPVILDELACGDSPILVTGRKLRDLVRLPSISEPQAIEQALIHVIDGDQRFQAVVSAGGETFMVYVLDGRHRIVDVSTGNKCASGTGEFFLQQIRRMDLDVEEAVELAGNGCPHAVSGRCSVFAKSDCTHALNKGELITDVTAGLCEMIADKIYDLLATIPHDRVIVTGGVALNSVVMGFLREKLSTLHIPEEAPYFEALGAALASFELGKPLPAELFDPEHSSFTFLPHLEEAASLVTFNEITYQKAHIGDRCVVSLDVGSTTTKAVVMRHKNHLVTPNLVGEYDRIIGTMHRDALSTYCGVVSIGPFGCMQLRFAEAVAHTQTTVKAKRIAMAAAGRDPVVPGFEDDDRIPFLSVESDGTPFPQLLQARFENFCLQAARVADKQGKRTDRLELS